MYQEVIDFIRLNFNKTTDSNDFIPLHEPKFIGNEKKYLNDCINSTFVSSVGLYVEQFEQIMAQYTGAKYAIATVNGTSALHIALLLADVKADDEVITQPLTFIATCNAIKYCQASPVFVDVDCDTMGLSAKSLKNFLQENCYISNNQSFNKKTKKVIKACVPMHTFGHSCKIDEIKSICDEYHIALVEDAAESLGSYFKNKHTGTFGQLGVFSFNGNKIITAGGGGCIITDNAVLAEKARHLTTTAKMTHQWEYTHDAIAYNYRMPNLNAALLVAQLEQMSFFLASKRELALKYQDFFSDTELQFLSEPVDCQSNYWLNALILESREQRDSFLQETNQKGVMTRPIWTLMNKLEMFQSCQCANICNAQWLEERVVNIPSSVRL